MSTPTKKIVLQVVDAPEHEELFVGFYVSSFGEQHIGLTRNPKLALGYELLDPALNDMINHLHSPFTFAPRVVVDEEVSA